MRSLIPPPAWASSSPDEARTLLHRAHGTYLFTPSERGLAMLYAISPTAILGGCGHLLASRAPSTPALALPLILGVLGLLLGARVALRISSTVTTVSRTDVVLSTGSSSHTIPYSVLGAVSLQPSWPFPLLVIHPRAGGHVRLRIPRALMSRLLSAIPPACATTDADLNPAGPRASVSTSSSSTRSPRA